MNSTLIVAICSLIVAIFVHIIVIARWSGKIDGYLIATADNLKRIDHEIERLRAARHEQEGALQRHEGLLKEFERRSYRTAIAD